VLSHSAKPMLTTSKTNTPHSQTDIAIRSHRHNSSRE
jgi:hypothetical protein